MFRFPFLFRDGKPRAGTGGRDLYWLMAARRKVEGQKGKSLELLSVSAEFSSP